MQRKSESGREKLRKTKTNKNVFMGVWRAALLRYMFLSLSHSLYISSFLFFCLSAFFLPCTLFPFFSMLYSSLFCFWHSYNTFFSQSFAIIHFSSLCFFPRFLNFSFSPFVNSSLPSFAIFFLYLFPLPISSFFILLRPTITFRYVPSLSLC